MLLRGCLLFPTSASPRRNRLRACKIAQIEPNFTEFKGQDPRDFIFSANGERRNVTIGQKALAYALIFPEPAKVGRGQKVYDEKGLGSKTFAPWVSQARTVIEHFGDLVADVKAGIITLDNAYRQALERKRAKEWLEDGIRRLHQVAKDLAVRVEAGDITFNEARTLLKERENIAREVRATTFQDLREFVRHGQGFAKGQRFTELPQWLEQAKYSLAECSRIDYCRDWANKAEALASHARQANDHELRRFCDRIQARAIERAGELLKEIPPAHGANQKHSGG